MRCRTRMATLLTGVLLIALAAAPTTVAQGTGSVTYLTAEGFYLDVGTAAGLSVGDTVTVVREGQTVAKGQVLFVAETSASCALLEGEVREGDRARFLVPEGTALPERIEADPPQADEAQVPAVTRRTLDRSAPARPINELDGRIALQLRSQVDDESGHDVMEPGISARLRLRNLFGSAHTLSVRARSRRTVRDREVGSDLRDAWNNRVYEVALEYDDSDSPLGYRVGRITANRVRGIGSFDGACADYRVKEDWSVGTFAGLSPDPTTSRVNPDDVKAGAFVNHQRGDWAGQRVDATLALAGSYHQGEIDEEFLYQQVRYSWGRSLSLYESAELALNRGWRGDEGASTLELDNILLSARWQPIDMLSLDGGYDNRRILRTWETRDTPDSLFDGSVREGWRLGAAARLTRDLRLSVQGNLRSVEGEADNTLTGHARISHRDMWSSGVAVDVRVAYYDSPYSTGVQPSLALARYVARRVRVSVEGGLRRYDYTGSDDSRTDAWIRPALSSSIGQRLYGQAYVEFTRGDMENTTRGFVELGYRF